VVTIVGSGFAALSQSYTLRASFLRCRFGAVTQSIPPSFHNDTHVICITTYGPQTPFGVSVGVSLNSVNFHTTDVQMLSFNFEGLHAPAIVEAYFPSEATTLVLVFDPQPTNRAGMNGIGDCSQILDSMTVAQLYGSPPADASAGPPQCDWVDDYTLVVFLSLYTSVGPGMRVGILSNVLWPAEWNCALSSSRPLHSVPCDSPTLLLRRVSADPGSCDGASVSESFCAGALSTLVDEYFPCDTVATRDVREACVVPEAIIQAPTTISSCAGTSLALSAVRSTGGGIKPLIYQWGAHPRRSLTPPPSSRLG
jgi:hypothetical protein